MVRFLVLGLLLLTLGCEQEQIHSYVALKDKPLDAAAEAGPGLSEPAAPTRMLAAILPQGESLWFFKMTGPPDETATMTESFGTFVTSTRFVGSEPTWEVPSDWKAGPEKEMRFATYFVGPSGLELSITRLGTGDDLNDALLANVNRWRGQLGLSNLTLEAFLARKVPEADGEIIDSQSPAGRVILINFVGEMSASGAMPPFARRMGSQPPMQAPVDAAPSGELKYTTPAGWVEGPKSGIRLAAFEIRGGNQVGETTIITARGSYLDNINRWRGQVQLAPWSPAELEQNTTVLKADSIDVRYVKLVGEVDGILGAVFDHGGQTWFVKFKGPAALAEAEASRFEAFVRSIRFE